MRVTTSYRTKIVGYSNIFSETISIYRKALAYLIDVVDAEWDFVKNLKSAKSKMSYIEKMVHNTARNIAKYDFDKQFYKLPSYYRRAVINKAVGIVSSFRSNYENWEANGKKGMPPKLQTKHFSFPTMYKDNMFLRDSDYTARVKIYHNNDWVWLNISLRKSDVDYIQRHKLNIKESAPTLEKRGKCWFLRFAYEEKRELYKNIDIITAVDLGINNAATCSALLSDGTVIGRKIFNFPIEKDRIDNILEQIKEAQRKGAKKTPRLWSFANNYNRTLSEKTANAIIEFALRHGSKAIVFENLSGMKGKKRGSKKQKLHLWRKQSVIALVTTKAHLHCMRISTVCAWKTSRLAFDGTGAVVRGKYIQNGKECTNYSISVFSTGKIYHADLNASYNIGARYFIREHFKKLTEQKILAVQAKVPALAKRTTCTLNDLISLVVELAA